MNNLLNLLLKYDNENMNKIKENIKNNKSLTIKEIDEIENSIKNNNPLDLDNILYNIMLEVALYNSKLHGSIIVEETPEIHMDVVKKGIGWDDILTYLEIDYENISPVLQKEMKERTNLKSIEETARFIKNSRKAENRIINKINDVDIIICILLYSGKKYISNIISYFKNGDEVDGRALGKAIESIPSIFLVNAPDRLPSNYDLFIKNYELLKNNDVEVRNIIINKPIIMVSPHLEDLINAIKGVV